MKGQVKLQRTDVAMNSFYEKVAKQHQPAIELPDKMNSYLQSDCMIPLPKYQDNGVFANYIQRGNAFSSLEYQQPATGERVATGPGQLIKMEEQQIQSTTLSDKAPEEGQVKGIQGQSRPITQLKSLGKVQFSRKEQKEREIYLGLSSKGIRTKSTFKEPSNNASLQQAWNTTGFLPTTISSVGQKNSVKDFEYLKFLNDTILKDDVLDQFMLKASEIEQAAGPKAHSPNKKVMTPVERMQSEFKRNPHRMHTCTRFDSFFQNRTAKLSKGRKVSKDAKTIDEESTGGRRPAEKPNTSTDRHRSCGLSFKQNSNSKQLDSPSKSKRARQKSLSKNNNITFPNSQNTTSREAAKDCMKSQPRLAQIIEKNKNNKKRQQQTRQANSSQELLEQSEVSFSKPSNSTRNGTRRNATSQDRTARQMSQLQRQRQQRKGRQQKNQSADASSQDTTTEIEMKNDRNLENLTAFERRDKLSLPLNYNTAPGGGNPYMHMFKRSSKGNTQMTSPQLGSQKSSYRKQKLITNITGQVTDKLKLTTRLNAAVDDLIKMGQKYKEKSLLIQQQIPMSSNIVTSFNQTQNSFDFINSKNSSVQDILSVSKVRQTRTQLCQSINPIESSLVSIDEYGRKDEESAGELTPTQKGRSKTGQARPKRKQTHVMASFEVKGMAVLNAAASKLRDGVYSNDTTAHMMTEGMNKEKSKTQERQGMNKFQKSSYVVTRPVEKPDLILQPLTRNQENEQKRESFGWELRKRKNQRKSGTVNNSIESSLPSITKTGNSALSPKDDAASIDSFQKSPLIAEQSEERTIKTRSQEMLHSSTKELSRGRNNEDSESLYRIYNNKMVVSGDNHRGSSQLSVSKDKLAHIKRNTNKKVSQIVLGNEKRKLNNLDKHLLNPVLNPVLNTGSSNLKFEEPIRLQTQSSIEKVPQSVYMNTVQDGSYRGEQRKSRNSFSKSSIEEVLKSRRSSCPSEHSMGKVRPPYRFNVSKESKENLNHHQSSRDGTPEQRLAAAKNQPLKPVKLLKRNGKVTKTTTARDDDTSCKEETKKGQQASSNATLQQSSKIASSGAQLDPGYIIQKDEAIEMIQIGPPHQFSTVLCQYLSSQANQMKIKSNQSSTRYFSGSEQPVGDTTASIMPDSQFAKAQQNLLLKDQQKLKQQPSQQVFGHKLRHPRKSIARANSIHSYEVGQAAQRNPVVVPAGGHQRQRQNTVINVIGQRNKSIHINKSVRHQEQAFSQKVNFPVAEIKKNSVFDEASMVTNSKDLLDVVYQTNQQAMAYTDQLLITNCQYQQDAFKEHQMQVDKSIFDEQKTACRAATKMADVYSSSVGFQTAQQKIAGRHFQLKSANSSITRSTVQQQQSQFHTDANHPNQKVNISSNPQSKDYLNKSLTGPGSIPNSKREEARQTQTSSWLPQARKQQLFAQGYSSSVQGFNRSALSGGHSTTLCNQIGQVNCQDTSIRQEPVSRTKSVASRAGSIHQQPLEMSGQVDLNQGCTKRVKLSRNSKKGKTAHPLDNLNIGDNDTTKRQESQGAMQERIKMARKLAEPNLDRLKTKLTAKNNSGSLQATMTKQGVKDASKKIKQFSQSRAESIAKRRNIKITTQPTSHDQEITIITQPSNADSLVMSQSTTKAEQWQQRPNLKRPSFLENSQLSQQNLTNDLNKFVSRVRNHAKETTTGDITSIASPTQNSVLRLPEQPNRSEILDLYSLQQPQSLSNDTKVTLNRIMQRAQMFSQETSPVQGPQPQTQTLSIEEQLQHSSIMAMQLDGFDTSQSQAPVSFKQMFGGAINSQRQQIGGGGSN